MTSLDIRSNSTVMKRNEQLKRWEESDTNSAPAVPRPEIKRKIKFSSGCVFLAACSSGDKEEVLSLLDSGADINTANVDGLTALHQACIDDNLEMVEFLVEHGADINRQDNEGWTPLHATVSCGFVSIARYLVEHGADVAAVNSDGDLAVDLAVDIQHVPMIEYMQKVVNERNIDLQKARDAELDQMLKDAKQWLRSDASEADRTHPKTGATALHVAAAKGYTKVLSLLLAGRANVDKQDNDGWTPLHAAAHWGQKESAEMLVNAMADIEIRNYAGQTCIDVAERKIVKFLEELRANNKRTKRRPSSQIRISDAIENHNAGSKIIRVEVKPDQTKEHANDEKAKLTTDLLATAPTSAFKGQTTESTAAEEDAPWRRNSLARVRVQNESPTKNQVPDKDMMSRTSIGSESSDVILRRTQSFENDEKRQLTSPPASPATLSTAATNAAVNTNTSAAAVVAPIRRSFVPPVRDEESETQRKAHAKRVRETRRSTQGVTLDEIKSAEELVKKKNASMNNNNNNSGLNVETTTSQTQTQTPPTTSTTTTAEAITTAREMNRENATTSNEEEKRQQEQEKPPPLQPPQPLERITVKGQMMRPQTLPLLTTLIQTYQQPRTEVKEVLASKAAAEDSSEEEEETTTTSTTEDEEDEEESDEKNVASDDDDDVDKMGEHVDDEQKKEKKNNEADNKKHDEDDDENEDEDEEEEETDDEDYKSPTITLHSPNKMTQATITFADADVDVDDTEVSVNYTIKRRETPPATANVANVEETIVVVNRSATKTNADELTNESSQAPSITSSPFESFEQEENNLYNLNANNSINIEIEKTDDEKNAAAETTTSMETTDTTTLSTATNIEATSNKNMHDDEKLSTAAASQFATGTRRIGAAPLIQQQQTTKPPLTPTGTTITITTPVTTPTLESPVRLRDKRMLFDLEKRYADAHRYQNDPTLSAAASICCDMPVLESSTIQVGSSSSSSTSLPCTPMHHQAPLPHEIIATTSSAASTPTAATTAATTTPAAPTNVGISMAERRPSWRLKFSNDSKFKLEDVSTGASFPPNNSTIIPSAPAVIAAANQRRINSVGNAIASSNQSLNSIGRPVSAPTSTTIISNLNSNAGSTSAGSVLSSGDNSATNEKTNDNNTSSVSIMGRRLLKTTPTAGTATTTTTSGVAANESTASSATSTASNTPNLVATTAANVKSNKEDNDNDKENDNRSALAIQTIIQRRRKPKRRSTGRVNLDMDELEQERQDSANDADEKESGSEQRSRSRVGSITASGSTSSSNNNSAIKTDSRSQSQTENGEPDYKALWQAARVEIDQLKHELVKKEDQLAQTNAAMSRIANATSKNSLSELEKRERRAMERKLSELEEELKQLDFYKAESLRLKEENGALIRVISKLSKN